MQNPKQIQELYTRLLASYRAIGPKTTLVGRAARSTYITAKKALDVGWPELGLPPISVVLEEDRLRARAELEADKIEVSSKQKKILSDARTSAVKAHAEEGMVVELARGQALEMLQVALRLGMSATEVADALEEAIRLEARKLRIWTDFEAGQLDGGALDKPRFERPLMDAEKMLRLLNKASEIVERIVATARQSMEMERLHLGQPTNTIELTDNRDIPEAEVALRLRAGVAAIEKMMSAKKPHQVSAARAGLDQEPDVVIGERVEYN